MLFSCVFLTFGILALETIGVVRGIGGNWSSSFRGTERFETTDFSYPGKVSSTGPCTVNECMLNPVPSKCPALSCSRRIEEGLNKRTVLFPVRKRYTRGGFIPFPLKSTWSDGATYNVVVDINSPDNNMITNARDFLNSQGHNCWGGETDRNQFWCSNSVKKSCSNAFTGYSIANSAWKFYSDWNDCGTSKDKNGCPSPQVRCTYNVRIGTSSKEVLDTYVKGSGANCWGGNANRGTATQQFWCSRNGKPVPSTYQLNRMNFNWCTNEYIRCGDDGSAMCLGYVNNGNDLWGAFMECPETYPCQNINRNKRAGSDGCSGGVWTGAITNYGLFEEACVQHDNCWSHNHKEDCNAEFYSNMIRLCDTYNNGIGNSLCHTDANTMTDFVRKKHRIR